VCASCQQKFPANQAIFGRCRNCAPNVDAALNAMPKADYTDHAGAAREREMTGAIVSVVGGILLLLLYILIKTGVLFGGGGDY
jgi:hypothetical protein